MRSSCNGSGTVRRPAKGVFRMQQIIAQRETLLHRQMNGRRIDGIYLPPGRAKRIAQRLQRRHQRKRIEVKEVSYRYNPAPLDSYLISADYRREEVPELVKTESLRSAAMIPVIQYSRITRTNRLSRFDEWRQYAKNDLLAAAATLASIRGHIDVSGKKVFTAIQQLMAGMVAVASFYGSWGHHAYQRIKEYVKPATSYSLYGGAVVSRFSKIRGWLPLVLPSFALGLLFAVFAGRSSTIPINDTDAAPVSGENRPAEAGSQGTGTASGNNAGADTSAGTAPADETAHSPTVSNTPSVRNVSEPVITETVPSVGGYGAGSETGTSTSTGPDATDATASDSTSTTYDGTSQTDDDTSLLPSTSVTVPEQTIEVDDTTLLETSETEVEL